MKLTRCYTAPRRFSARMFAAVLLCLGICRAVEAQTAAPTVLPSYVAPLTAPSGIGGVLQSAVDRYGNWLVPDWVNGALYEYPVTGGGPITLDGPGTLGNKGGYQNPSIAFGANNDLYLAGNFNNCLFRFPWDPAKNTWDGLSTFTTSNQAPNSCGKAPYSFAQYGITVTGTYPGYFQPWGIAVDKNNNLVINIQNGNNQIFSLGVNGTGINSTPGPGTVIINKLTKRANSIAVDPRGDIFFVEDSGGLKGAYMIPSGSTGVASDTDPSIVRVDPNLANVSGVATDALGNIYVSDSAAGVYLVPNTGGAPNVANAYRLTAQPATAQVGIDSVRGIVYIPNTTAAGFNALDLNTASVGQLAVGKSSAAAPIVFNFFGSSSPHSFAIEEAGLKTADFTTATTGTCFQADPKTGLDIPFMAGSSCSESVTFSPQAAGNRTAKLLMLDVKGNVLATMNLQGLGIASEVAVLPGGAETTFGGGNRNTAQIAADLNANVYVADTAAGLLLYPKGATPLTAGTAISPAIKAPTGVAVDGAGNVFVAASGNVFEIPVTPSGGINVAGQITLKAGLGSNLKLALSTLGSLYITDPDNHRIVELSDLAEASNLGFASATEIDIPGFQAPSGVAVDSNNNVYVLDGANLYEIAATGLQSTLLTTLKAPTGIAVDASGSVYVTEQGGTVRIPSENGTITPADQAILAPDNTSANSVALDSIGNVYLTNPATGAIEVVSVDAAFNFGTLTTTSSTASQTFTVVNIGNAPLTVTGFAGTTDYSASATTCTAATVPVGGLCSVTVLFNPGPGDQGSLTGLVSVTGNEAYTPVGVQGSGVGAALLGSKTTITVASASVYGAPTSITVASATGTSPTPTGQVVLSISNSTLTTPITVSGTLVNGALTLNPLHLQGGSYTFTASYIGDRVYGKSSASASVVVAPGAVILTQPTMAQVQQALPTYPYILSAASGADEPYDGSVTQFEYNYQVKVTTTDGSPLVGIPVYDAATGKQTATNYGSIVIQGPAAGSTCGPYPVAADGTATFVTTCLTINTANSSVPNILTAYTITPQYTPAGSGPSAGSTNPNYTGVAGKAIAFTALRNPMVQIAANPGALSIQAGSSANVTLTLSSILGYGIAGSGGQLNNYSLPVQLVCDGLPANATCTFTYPTPDPTDPQSVDVGPLAGTVLQYRGGSAAPCTKAQGCVGPGTVVMTIQTNVPQVTTSSVRHGENETAFAAIFGIGLCGMAFGKRRSLGARLLLMLVVLGCGSVTAGITGCSTTQLGTSTGTPTPAGTYTVMVAAKQVGSQITSGTNPITVYGSQNQMSLPFTMNVTIQ